MKIGLFPVDGKYPNLALMKLSSFYKSSGCEVTLKRPGDINFISAIFTSSRPMVQRILEAYPNSAAGGPGWDPAVSLPLEVERCQPDYSLFGIEYGIGRLTSGCPGDCPWCVVPQAEGRDVKTVATLEQLINPRGDLVVLLDSNILASPDWIDHFREIQRRGIWADFTQGMDIRLVNDFVASELAKIRHTSLNHWLQMRAIERRLKRQPYHFAWDKIEIEQQVRAGVAAFSKYLLPLNMTFYMLVGYDTSWEEDWYRFEVLRSLRVHPFVMLYKGEKQVDPILRHFARWVNKRIYKVCRWHEYRNWQGYYESSEKVGEQKSLFCDF